MTTIVCQNITAKELQQKREEGETIDLIDVRTPIEFREIHVDYACNEPLDRLNPVAIMERHGDQSKPLYVMCRTGNRAKQAIEKFHQAGYENVINVEGGVQQWDADQLPVIRGKKAISLERQVRIAAGSLVFTGAMLGYFVNPLWIFLSAFVGAGLVFAGVTDTCGMGMMLAKMPWNQVKESPGCDAK
ncbi:MAG: rhodanese-like domain-containing protein [Planctomycetes bacterium]|nr:rhodanese-like domain-containing protein [Planctomycetota bacterium]